MQLGQSSRDDKFADEVAYNSNDFIAVCFDDQKARSPEVFFKKKRCHEQVRPQEIASGSTYRNSAKIDKNGVGFLLLLFVCS